MKGQRPLQVGTAKRRLRLSDARGFPTVWVREIRVLHRLESGSEHEVRRVSLRRGLNILWARSQPSEGSSLFHGSLSGHTAGKTTFCRLLRYVLGEPTFGPRSDQQSIRTKVPEGWVVAEINVGGSWWVVGRPFRQSAKSFALPDTHLDAALKGGDRGEYETFLATLNEATTATLPSRTLLGGDECIEWRHLLPWLTRDQDARFAELTSWRHASSESQSWLGSAGERNSVVEAVLALRSDNSTDEEKKQNQLEASLRGEQTVASSMSERAVYASHFAAKRLGHTVDEIVEPLFVDRLWSEIHEAERRIVADATSAHDDTFATRVQTAQAASAHVATLEARVHGVEARLMVELDALGLVSEAHRAAGQESIVSAAALNRRYCNVLLTDAQKAGCPLAPAPLTTLEELRAKRSQNENVAASQAVADGLRTELDRLRQQLAAARRESEHAAAAVQQLYGEHTARATELERRRAEQRERSRLLDEVHEARIAARDSTERLESIKINQKQSLERLAELRHQHNAAREAVSATYSMIVQALVDAQAIGRVKSSKNGVEAPIEWHGDRSSAAIRTLKLLAFDLAALTASIEGDGFHPRFLVHDGPREADMAEDLYGRLFHYARWLELQCNGEPAFQYIVTTTTAPPDELRRGPWLLDPVLDASTADGRLLRVDL